MMPYLWTAKQPYNVNVAAAQTAIASLDDKETLRTSVATLRSSRANLFTLLESLPMLTPYPSQANFILCRVSGLTAQTLKQRLATDYGILVRYFNKPGLTDCIRISIGTPQQIDKLTEALNTIQTEVSSAAYS